jgi:hypothetical protein
MQGWVIATGALALGFFAGLYWATPASAPAALDPSRPQPGTVPSSAWAPVEKREGPQATGAEPVLKPATSGGSDSLSNTAPLGSQERALGLPIYDVDNYLPPPRPPAHIGEDLTHIPDP